MLQKFMLYKNYNKAEYSHFNVPTEFLKHTHIYIYLPFERFYFILKVTDSFNDCFSVHYQNVQHSKK